MTPIEDLASWALTTAATALDETEGIPDAPQAKRVHFGLVDTIAWDAICDGGQLVAAVEPWSPSARFPSPINDVEKGASLWVVPVTLELVRCIPQNARLSDQGALPKTADVEALHVGLMDQAWALACKFDQVLRHNPHPGYIRNVSTLVAGDGAAVRVALQLQVP